MSYRLSRPLVSFVRPKASQLSDFGRPRASSCSDTPYESEITTARLKLKSHVRPAGILGPAIDFPDRCRCGRRYRADQLARQSQRIRGPYITGWLTDLTGDTRVALWVVGALSLSSAALVVYLGARPKSATAESKTTAAQSKEVMVERPAIARMVDSRLVREEHLRKRL
jgi:hypothetical protein